LKPTPYTYIHKNKTIAFRRFVFSIFLITVFYNSYSQNKKNLFSKRVENISDTITKQKKFNFKIKNDSCFNKEIIEIRNRLDNLGYLEHAIEDIDKTDSIYKIQFNLNQITQDIKLINPNLPFINETIRLNLKNDSNSITLPVKYLESTLNKISDYFRDNGFPFVEIKLIDIKKEENHLISKLKIKKYEIRKIDKIIIKGYSSFPKSHIKQVLNIEEGSNYSETLISEIHKKCLSIPFISEIKEPQLLFSKDSTHLYLYIKKKKSNYFDGLIGFSNSIEKKNLQLYGTVNLKIQNALNAGESLHFDWISTQNKSQSIKLSLQIPYILNSPFSTSYTFDIYKKDSSFNSISHILRNDYQITPMQKIGFILNQEQSYKITTQSKNNIIDYNSLFYGLTYAYLKTNPQLLFPIKMLIFNQVSRGKRNKEKQYKLTNQIEYLVEFSEKNNLLFKTKAEILLSNSFTENELFRLGGTKSIRGFDEHLFSADSYLYINNEYNYIINHRSFISGIVDIGLVNNQLESLNTLVYSMGIGFSQHIKAGQLHILYMVGNTQDQAFGFKNSKLHFRLSQSF
jgi:outer membrane protein assembly factor BamA